MFEQNPTPFTRKNVAAMMHDMALANSDSMKARTMAGPPPSHIQSLVEMMLEKITSEIHPSWLDPFQDANIRMFAAIADYRTEIDDKNDKYRFVRTESAPKSVEDIMKDIFGDGFPDDDNDYTFYEE